MSERVPRSPYDMVSGLVFIPRMLDKIRLHAGGDMDERIDTVAPKLTLFLPAIKSRRTKIFLDRGLELTSVLR